MRSSLMNQQVTLVEKLELTALRDEFNRVVSAAITRLEREGIHALRSVRFFAEPGTTQIGAILTFSDAARMMEHVQMISTWPEFAAILHVLRPLEVRAFGPLNDDVRAWLSSMKVDISSYPEQVAGFSRDSSGESE